MRGHYLLGVGAWPYLGRVLVFACTLFVADMKLKIDYIFDIVANSYKGLTDCLSQQFPTFSDSGIDYHFTNNIIHGANPCWLLAKDIIADIIPYFIASTSLSFEEIYRKINFERLDKRAGFHLGIPYYKFDRPTYSSAKDVVKDYDKYCEHGYYKGIPFTDWGKKIPYMTKEFEKDIQDKLLQLNFEYEKIVSEFNARQNLIIIEAFTLRSKYYCGKSEDIIDYLKFILASSFYPFEFGGDNLISYNPETKILIVDYELPHIEQIPNYKNRGTGYLSDKEQNKLYDEAIYNITIRSIAELFHYDTKRLVQLISFNGKVATRNKATGKLENSCILSVQVGRTQFESIDLNYIDAKACFKHFKGVGSSKLCDMTAIVPIMEINRQDKRFVDAQSIVVDNGTNLAAMGWEDFEHLIRELFDKEFNQNGGEVKITQSSRDGGVDAIAFDPDPIRGGKIVIQAKRYTNTVGVSAVRDLYGTVINEGANKGILITTSEYGSDSYNFAKDKPITLLNGGHLLYLLEKHGQKARIDLAEAKEVNSKL